jgi:hypothetical protein
MNPFQSYAYGYTSPYNFPPEAPRTLEPMPVYSPRNAGYMGIYGTQPTREETPVSPGVSSVIRGMQEGSAGEGSRDNPATAGGTATTDNFRDFAVAALAGLNPMTAALSVLGQMAINPTVQPTNPSLVGLLSAAADKAGDIFGGGFNGPGGRAAGAPETIGGVSEADMAAAAQSEMDAAAAAAAAEVAASPAGADIAAGQGSEWARGGYVPGHSGGMDDDVPAVIDGKGPARLSSGEFVFDAATVAALGDGNNTAGAKKLDGLRKAIRKKAYGHEKQPPKNYSVGDLVRLYDKGR